MLECLVALLMLSGILLVLNGLIKHVHRTELLVSRYHDREWEVGCIQLENELEGLTLIKIEPHRIVLENEKKEEIKIERSNSTVKKNYNSGYQPLFTKVKSFNCKEKLGSVEFWLTFYDGTTKIGNWIIE
ncbi:competence protein ComG [Enterococcus florum]|uniref:Competence protein ComG n=1 Tax=Enterococcus florum TaxID=2480627 RepID=A0A4P5PEI0_9ENTE|nr:competence protein ComG [Enterococcus florum]